MSIYKETIKRFLVGGKAQAQVTRTAQLDLAQFYADCASLGSTVDATLFENSLKALPEVARNEAISYLVPGAYKLGMVYGFNSDTKSVLEFPFSRTSSATYIDKNGLMQTAPPNMPRIDYDPLTGECKGYLQEAATINLCKWSNIFSNWGGVGINVGAALSGVNTSCGKEMWAVSKLNSTSSAPLSSILLSSLANTTYCFRVTLRAGTSDKVTIGIGTQEDGPTGIWGLNENCTFRKIRGAGNISRFSIGSLALVTGLSASSDTVVEVTRKYVNAGIFLGGYIYVDTHQSTVVGASVLASCGQIEIGETCSSYVETDNAVGIRTADLLASSRDIIPYNAASLLMDSYATRTINTYYYSKGSSGRFWYTSSSKKNDVSSFDGLNASSINVADVERLRVITSFGVSLKISANGNIGAVSPFVGTFGSGVLQLGSAAGFIAQRIKALAIIPRQLTDAEHITATTL